MFGWKVNRWDNQTLAFSRTSVHSLQNVNHLLFIIECPIHLIIVSSPKVHHYMSIPEEKHCRTRVIQLIHCAKIRHLLYVNQVNHCKILHLFRAFSQHFVLFHTQFIRIFAKANAYHSFIFLENCLVNFPAIV